jgi:hypothetical protein
VRTDRQEPDLIASRPVLLVVVATVVLTAVGVAVAWLLEVGQLGAIQGDAPPPRPPRIPTEVSAIETQIFARRAQGLEDNRAAERWLSSYGWIDREQGVVHIPIEAAIELYLSRQGGER